MRTIRSRTEYIQSLDVSTGGVQEQWGPPMNKIEQVSGVGQKVSPVGQVLQLNWAVIHNITNKHWWDSNRKTKAQRRMHVSW